MYLRTDIVLVIERLETPVLNNSENLGVGRLQGCQHLLEHFLVAFAQPLRLAGVELKQRDPDVKADELLKGLPSLRIFLSIKLAHKSLMQLNDSSDCLQVLSRPELVK